MGEVSFSLDVPAILAAACLRTALHAENKPWAEGEAMEERRGDRITQKSSLLFLPHP